MKILVLKNLAAHRESNKMTSIIYSLTLGSIIFIVVAANLQLSLFSGTAQSGLINYKVVFKDSANSIMIDPIL